jgi:hypothetical protein
MNTSSFRLQAVVTDNPELTLKVGDSMELLFESARFPTTSPIPHTSVANWGIFEGAVLAVAFPSHELGNVFGSAVMVAPGVAIGTMHVFDATRDEVLAAQVGALCYGVDGDRIDIWRIRHVTSLASGKSDLAFFSLELASALPADRTFTHAMLSTRTPSVGEQLTIVGFRQADAVERVVGEARLIEMQMLHSTGLVTEQYPHQRDSVGLPCPCVEVACHAPGGMSGGPVFDPQGRLVGVLSRGLDEGPSWALLLWPALGWSFPGGWPAAIMTGHRRLVDLDRGLCMIERPEAVSLQKGGLELRYDPWT